MKRKYRRQGGHSLFRRALRDGTARVVTPAGTGMARTEEPGGEGAEPVLAKSERRRLTTYGATDQFELTPAQRRRWQHKRNRAAGR